MPPGFVRLSSKRHNSRPQKPTHTHPASTEAERKKFRLPREARSGAHTMIVVVVMVVVVVIPVFLFFISVSSSTTRRVPKLSVKQAAEQPTIHAHPASAEAGAESGRPRRGTGRVLVLGGVRTFFFVCVCFSFVISLLV